MFLIPPAIQQSTTNAVQTELEAMLVTDQKGRKELEAATKKYGSFSPEVVKLWEKQNRIDLENQKHLIKIVGRIGWPKKSEVGYLAAISAFLILQHADLKLQQEYLPLFRSSALAGEAELSSLALLEDRVLVREGKKQLYGTQLKTQKGVEGFQLEPIEDEENVDARRAKMDLGPLAEYLKGFGIEYRKPAKIAPNLSLKSDPA